MLSAYKTKILGTQGSSHLAAHDELRRRGRLGFDQNWIEVRARSQTTGGCLDRLCAADFFPIRRDKGIVGHVLGFEGRDSQPSAEKRPAQGRGEDGFADMRGGSLNHECARRHPSISPPLSRCFGAPRETPVPLVSWPPIEPTRRAHHSADSET